MACNINTQLMYLFSFLKKRWNTAVSAFGRVGAIQILAQRRFQKGTGKKTTCWCWEVWEESNGKISKILLCSSVEGISLVGSAGFEAVNKLPVFLLGNTSSVYAVILLFNACFCKTLLKCFQLLSILSLSHWRRHSPWLMVTHCWSSAVLLRSKIGRRQEVGQEGTKI